MVKKDEIVMSKVHFAAEALRILRDTPGVTVEVDLDSGIVAPTPSFASLARSHLSSWNSRACNAAAAWQLARYAEAHPDASLLLIAGETPRRGTSGILADHGIGLIDGLGNAHIELPGLMFHIEGHAARVLRARLASAGRLASRRRRSFSIRTATGRCRISQRKRLSPSASPIGSSHVSKPSGS